MLIFDRFPNKELAKHFAFVVRHRFGAKTILCVTHDEFDQHEVFPYQLDPPIVLVERDHSETKVREIAADFGGTFAGT